MGSTRAPTSSTTRAACPHAAYRIVLAFNADLGQFYGVQGTTWQQPPILTSPQEIRVVGGKRLELHFDGRRLRLVAWRTAQGVYWISNTLSLDLSNSADAGDRRVADARRVSRARCRCAGPRARADPL